MRTLSLLALGAAALIGGCTVERKTPPTDTSRAASSARPATADTAAAPAPSSSTDAWTVTPSGIGPIRVGMTVDDLRRVAGDIALPAGTDCAYVKPASAPPGVSVMIAKGQVTRVDVDSTGVRSDAAVAVGDSVERVMSAYPGRVTIAPHKYVQGGQYLTVRPSSPQDSTLRIVFEAERGRVTRFRSGRVPEVEWVERCG